MKVTFGKWQGWDTNEMAKSIDGRSYLSWGVENLDSPKWRKEFQRALDAVKVLDRAVSVKAAIHSANDLSQEDAEIYVGDHFRQAEEEAAFSDLQNRFRGYLLKNGISQAGVNFILSNIFSIEELDEMEQVGRFQYANDQSKKAILRGLNHYFSEVEKIRQAYL